MPPRKRKTFKVIARTCSPPSHAKLLNQMHADPRMRCDPLYALPADLLSELERRGVLDATVCKVERKLTAHCEGANIVGFYRHEPIRYQLLTTHSRDYDIYVGLLEQLLTMTGKSAKLPAIESELREVLPKISEFLQGYAGWLITNPQFRQEHDKLLAKWAQRIRFHELPEIGSTGMGLFGNAVETPEEQAEENRFLAAFGSFFVRWRLAGLAGPGLPIPIAPGLPVVDPDPLRWHMKAGGLTLFLPDTFPAPSRDELRRLTQTLQNRRTPKYLEGWAQIKAKKAQGETGARRFAHLLLLHHWLGILETRHADQIKGRMADVQSAMAKCLELKRESVRKLCQLRKRRLSGKT